MTLEITEKQFEGQIEDLLNSFGWHWCHFRPARTEKGWRTALTGHQGFPDIVAVRDSRVLFIELKSEKGKLTETQEEWTEALVKTCAEIYVWKPSQFYEIVECLR